MQDTQTSDNDNEPVIDHPVVEDQLNELNKESTFHEVSARSDEPDYSLQHPIAHAYITPQKSYKNLIISLVTAVIILIVAIGGCAYWYFGIRTPDIEYEKSSAIIDSMIGDAKALANLGAKLRDGATEKTTLTSIKLADTKSDTASILNMIDEAGRNTTSYLISQKKLEESIVISKDQSVQAVYEANKKVINEYGTSSDAMYKTADIYYTMLDRCLNSNAIIPSATIKTVSDYDIEAKLCKDYIENAKTVPIKDFNDNIYVPYKAILLTYITNMHNLYSEAAGSKAWNQALQNIVNASKDISSIDTSKVKKITNSLNPQSHLGKLNSKIDERKDILIR